MLLLTVGKRITGEQNGNVSSDLKSSGEPCAVKVACTVRKGGVGKVSLSQYIKRDNSLALYLTNRADDEIQKF